MPKMVEFIFFWIASSLMFIILGILGTLLATVCVMAFKLLDPFAIAVLIIVVFCGVCSAFFIWS